MGKALQGRRTFEPIALLPKAERLLSARDSKLARVIALQESRWPITASEHPIWGLMRIVMAQQISTEVACQIAQRVKSAYPGLTSPSAELVPDVTTMHKLGISRRRAECCVDIIRKSSDILAAVARGHSWEMVLRDIKGIGPWTISVFRIMVLRDPDVLPLGDVGLQRAVAQIYGESADLEQTSENWRPFRSVACWHLWRTLGNQQLG